MFEVTSSSSTTANDAPNLNFTYDSVKQEQIKQESDNYNSQFQMNNVNNENFQFQNAFITQG
jgi:hypothetical protein